LVEGRLQSPPLDKPCRGHKVLLATGDNGQEAVARRAEGAWPGGWWYSSSGQAVKRSSVSGPRRRRPYRRDSREILDSVVADPSADHSIQTMADRAAVSERHLVRMFRV
jgi:transcriptional regulator GlxA family with amidase domain